MPPSVTESYDESLYVIARIKASKTDSTSSLSTTVGFMERGFDANQDLTYVNIASEFCGLGHRVQKHIINAGLVGHELLSDLVEFAGSCPGPRSSVLCRSAHRHNSPS